MGRRFIRFLIFQTILISVLSGCALLEGINGQSSEGRIDVLFIGNSYTASNNLPKLFEGLAQSDGHKVHTMMVAPGGWTLSEHAQSESTLATIKGDAWDFIVLQEQSVIPSLMDYRQREMYPAVRNLKVEIEKTGAEVILFMTWGRRDGMPEEGHRSYSSMQDALEDGYVGIGDELDLAIAPVGIAWRNALRRAPDLDLWVQDGSHPNREGSYLAACVLYAVIFGQSPEGSDYTAGLDADWGTWYQNVAQESVTSNPDRWNLH